MRKTWRSSNEGLFSALLQRQGSAAGLQLPWATLMSLFLKEEVQNCGRGWLGKRDRGQRSAAAEAKGNWTATFVRQHRNLFCWEYSIWSKENPIFPQNNKNEITVFYPENVNGKFVPSYAVEYRLEIFGFLRKGRSSHFHSVKNEANRVHISLWSNDWFFLSHSYCTKHV